MEAPEGKPGVANNSLVQHDMDTALDLLSRAGHNICCQGSCLLLTHILSMHTPLMHFIACSTCAHLMLPCLPCSFEACPQKHATAACWAAVPAWPMPTQPLTDC